MNQNQSLSAFVRQNQSLSSFMGTPADLLKVAICLFRVKSTKNSQANPPSCSRLSTRVFDAVGWGVETIFLTCLTAPSGKLSFFWTLKQHGACTLHTWKASLSSPPAVVAVEKHPLGS